MPSIQRISSSVLKRIKPNVDEIELVGDFVRVLVESSQRISKEVILPCGSIGKSTWLKGDHDIDIFIIFPREMDRDGLEKKGLAFGKKIALELNGKYIIKYAEHPYVQAIIPYKKTKFFVDIVPCHRMLSGQSIKSAVDRSPLHMEFVADNISNRQDEVRLLKQFCKGIGVYGSDVKIRGFSGYVCELLVIKYGSFESTLKNAAKWTAPYIITFKKEKVDTKKFNHPLILIDPTDAKRNTAANISTENFVKFIGSASSFVKKPDKNYFFPKKPKPLSTKETKALKQRGTLFLAITMKKPDIIDDILYPQLRRSSRRITGLLEDNEFSVIRHYEWTNKEMALLFELDVFALPPIKRMEGPPIFSRHHSKEFLSKYSKQTKDTKGSFKPVLVDDKWVADVTRIYRHAPDLIKDFMKKPVKYLVDSGIPENIARAMKSGKLILNVWPFAKKDKAFSAFLKEKYF